MSFAKSSCRDSNPVAGILYGQGPERTEESFCNLQQLPDAALTNIISFLSYEEVARLRTLSRKFNRICSDHLNRGFFRLISEDSEIKELLELQRHQTRCSAVFIICDSITKWSISMGSYIRDEKVTFFAGKYLDKVSQVLPIMNLKWAEEEEGAYDPAFGLQVIEIFDLHMAAYDHFETVILPEIKMSSCYSLDQVSGAVSSDLQSHPTTSHSDMVSPQESGATKVDIPSTSLEDDFDQRAENLDERIRKLEADLEARENKNRDMLAKIKDLEERNKEL